MQWQPITRSEWAKGTSWLMCSLLGLLAGCAGDSEPMAQPAMSISPGYIQLDSGQTLQVMGMDKCGLRDYQQIGATPPRHLSERCVLVAPSDKSFEIMTGTPVGMVNERWFVETTADAVRLLRPNGDGTTVFRVIR